MQTRRNGIKAAMGMGGMLAVLMLAGTGFAVDIIDDPIQIDERTADVVQTSNSLCWEMHRYHRQNPDYGQAYRTAKQLWSQAGELRAALRAGPVETESLVQQVAQMNENLAQVERTMSKWGDGDRSLAPLNSGPGMRTVVTPGVSVNIPFVGVQVGGPRYVVTEDGTPALERRRLHPNSRGSKKSLERELAAVRVAVNYLMEDSGGSIEANPPAPGNPGVKGPVPQPPDAGLGEPVKVVPPSAKIPAGTPIRK
jgi:hypothetical protein